MTVVSEQVIGDHLDFIIAQPDYEQAVVRDLVFAVLAFNQYTGGEPLQVSFPLYAEAKVTRSGALGPCVRITGPAEKLYVLTLRYEIAEHLRAGRVMTLIRDRVVVEAGRNERFSLIQGAPKVELVRPVHARPLVLSGHSRLIETAGALGVAVKDEAVFVEREETPDASDGEVDLLGFSDQKTLPVLK